MGYRVAVPKIADVARRYSRSRMTDTSRVIPVTKSAQDGCGPGVTFKLRNCGPNEGSTVVDP